jgi:hypothetical protein
MDDLIILKRMTGIYKIHRSEPYETLSYYSNVSDLITVYI